MTTSHTNPSGTRSRQTPDRPGGPDAAPSGAATDGVGRGHTGIRASELSLAALRVALGFVFLWAFLDKTFGLGYATKSGKSWLDGGSPTEGFLSHVEVGPMASTLRGWAGAGWADWLFMLGLLGIGVAVILGIALRPAAVAGGVMMALMWIAEWPPAKHLDSGAASGSSNPFVDYHLVYALALIAVAAFAGGSRLGMGAFWARLPIVDRTRWLR